MGFISKHTETSQQIGFTLSPKKYCLGFSKMSFSHHPHVGMTLRKREEHLYLVCHLILRKICLPHTLPGSFAKIPEGNTSLFSTLSSILTLGSTSWERDSGAKWESQPCSPSYPASIILRIRTIMTQDILSLIPGLTHSILMPCRSKPNSLAQILLFSWKQIGVCIFF